MSLPKPKLLTLTIQTVLRPINAYIGYKGKTALTVMHADSVMYVILAGLPQNTTQVSATFLSSNQRPLGRAFHRNGGGGLPVLNTFKEGPRLEGLIGGGTGQIGD